jgi:broad specificity phosphatase PhoE
MMESGSLRRIVLVRAGAAEGPARERVDAIDAPLSDAGRSAIRERLRHWEWADAVVSSPLRRARQSAQILAREAPIGLLPELAARRRGDESPIDFEARVRRALVALARGRSISPLVVTHGSVIREIVAQLADAPIPDGRPHPAEMVLLTRTRGGKFRLGRRSSDPEPLRSPLERHGLSGSGSGDGEPERHVAHLEIRGG